MYFSKRTVMASGYENKSYKVLVIVLMFVHVAKVFTNNETGLYDHVSNAKPTECNGSVNGIGEHLSNETDFLYSGVIDISGCGLSAYQSIYKYCGQSRFNLINVSWNNIDAVDGLLCDWPSIRVVDFSYNHVALLHEHSFAGGRMVIRLYLTGNDIHQIETDAFSDISNLELLDLAENNLKSIGMNVFDGMTNLVSLNLARNNVHFITAGTFSKLRSLKSFDLSYNRLHELDLLSFSGLETLDALMLQGNRMKGYKLDFLSVFKNLTIVDLSENKFTHIGRNAFRGWNVSKLVISHCEELTAISSHAFVDSSYLTEIMIGENKYLYFLQENFYFNLDKLTHLSIRNNLQLHYIPILSRSVFVDALGVTLYCDCYQNITSNVFHYKVEPEIFSEYCNVTNTSTSIQVVNETVNDCGPFIVSHLKPQYSLFIGENVKVDCLVIGHPRPNIRWERARSSGRDAVYDVILRNMTSLNLTARFLSDAGHYRCVANNNNNEVFKVFKIDINGIDIGVQVVSRGSKFIVITWDRTHHVTRHVILYRAYEETVEYSIQKLNEYWKLFKIDRLVPSTEYEICIASKLDNSDRNCIRSETISENDRMPGIYKDSGVIAVLCMSGFVFGICVLATFYKCLRKLHVITKQHVFIVSSESRECFGDVTEATFTYENHFTDFVLENEDKTEF